MISIVTYGRNDNYSFNLVKRTAFSFNCLAEVLTEDDEILFVDYNTPDHLPTLPEFIWDTLTDKALKIVKVIRISRKLHDVLKKDSPLPVLEGVSRNAAIVRSNPKNHWILSTNPDVLLVLCSRWANLNEMLRTIPDSFYEMPRFDIPESIWSSLHRGDPKTNMVKLRDWLVSHKAAVAETAPSWQYQKYILFDAPGDFQLAPRDYFLRLHGFDESMNKYLHSDSNLAKRMWLLNGCRTDHLMGNIWVLHQDHYLSGEWATNFDTLVHNDSLRKVFHQKEVKANGDDWGLQDIRLPMFSLSERVAKQHNSFSQLPASAKDEEDLPLSREVDWRTEPIERLCHYDPEFVTLYLRESLQVTPQESVVVYLGQNRPTLEALRRVWRNVAPSGACVSDVSEVVERGESVTPDVLLVDFYYERPEYWERRVRLVQEQMQRRLDKGQITEREAAEETSEFANRIDLQVWLSQLVPQWEKLMPQVRMRSGSTVILLGCNTHIETFHRFKEVLVRCSMDKDGSANDLQKPVMSTQEPSSQMNFERQPGILRKILWKIRLLKREASHCSKDAQGPTDFSHGHEPEVSKPDFVGGSVNLQPLYVHHRIVVSRVA